MMNWSIGIGEGLAEAFSVVVEGLMNLMAGFFLFGALIMGTLPFARDVL